MFLNKNFVLANELVQKMGIKIANISMLRKSFEHNDDFYSVQKLNNCAFINRKARNLPNNIRQGLNNHEFTDVSNKLPIPYIRNLLDCTERELIKSDIVQGKEIIAGKRFYVFDEAFAHFVGEGVPYILNNDEHSECKTKALIKGSIQLNKNKFFVWY